MFEDLMRDVHATFAERFLKIQVSAEPPRPMQAQPVRRPMAVPETAGADDLFAPEPRLAPLSPVGVGPRLPLPPQATTNRGPARPGPAVQTEVGRNDPCPCGSGRKYKKCHGAA
jgi:preprotein translocase subunit SecA